MRGLVAEISTHYAMMVLDSFTLRQPVAYLSSEGLVFPNYIEEVLICDLT
jgi:hypothetical protein